MIDELHVQDLALIHDATLVPAGGLTVLTGETGAGKTALLSALKLLMGARADKEAVRDGEAALVVSGRFYGAMVPAGETTNAVDAEEGAPAAAPARVWDPDAELVVSRRVSADGRSRVSVDGRMASVRELASAVAPTIDLCGQHEQQRLMAPAEHLRMLDAWAGEGVAHALEAYRAAFKDASAAAARLAHLKEASESSSAKLDEARFTLQRIDAVSPAEGEYEDLLASLSRVEHAESLATSANAAHEALAGDGGAIDAVATAAQALDEGARFDERLGKLAESLRESSYVLEDVAREARDYRDGVEFDPDELERQQERMAAFQGLLRAYGPRMEDVLAARAEAAELVSLVDDSEERLSAAQREVDAVEGRLAEAAQVLDDARAEAAPRFAEAVTAQMARLEMGGAQLECRIERLPRQQWTRAGASSVEFLFRPGSGMQARPLVRIASGGEVSRVMLSIKVALGGSDRAGTLVFDEVDAGVGGSTAIALADVLADLALTHQVIVVTHLAQVAVRGDEHYVVRKVEGEAGMPETSLRRLSAEDRPAEIARMLSGDATEASLAHAREMLDAARA